MKLLTILFLLTISTLPSIGQRIDSAAISRLSSTEQAEVHHLLQQSKNFRTTGIVMGAGGGVLIIAGLASYANVSKKDVWLDGEDPDYSTSDALILSGVALALGSIPFTVLGAVKKGKARAIVFSSKNVSLAPNITLPGTQSLHVGLSIPLGK